jgi:hypothetical protein
LAISRIRDEIKELGEPIEYSEVVKLISLYPGRRNLFMRAYYKGKRLKRFIRTNLYNTNFTMEEFHQVFATLNFSEIVKLAGQFNIKSYYLDEQILRSTLDKIIKNCIREQKLKELAKYYKIVTGNE